MGLADIGLACNRAESFVLAVEASKRAYDNGSWNTYDEQLAVIRRGLPLMRDIAERIHPEVTQSLYEPETVLINEWGTEVWPLRDLLAAAQELCGVLANWQVRNQIFGASGPSLDASGLHEWVWDAAKGYWDDGYFSDAVHAAAEVVNHKTQVKLGRPDISGARLYRQAFSLEAAAADAPRLRLTSIGANDEDSWKSAHEGALCLGIACTQGFRNLAAHKKADLDEQEALEQLGALSILARWVDNSEVDVADSQ